MAIGRDKVTPTVRRDTTRGIAEDAEKVARGPKHIVGKRSWVTDETSDGGLGTKAKVGGKYRAALFNPITGEYAADE